MLTILLHTSKTMRPLTSFAGEITQKPLLNSEAQDLASYLKSLSTRQLQKWMHISPAKAKATHALIEDFAPNRPTLPAIDIFLGDIYSGFQAPSLSPKDREYANDNRLFILSGLYGALRPLDGTQPYRLEMGYKLPGNSHNSTQPDITSLYDFWGEKIANLLPKNQDIINLSAVEYTKAVFPYLKNIDGLENVKIITPKFLTVSPKTGEPTFVTVHAKIARGACARWLIQNRVESLEEIKNFNGLGYHYSAELSTENEPVFVVRDFQGIGLSIRLSK